MSMFRQFFLVTVIESAALQTLWLALSAVTILSGVHAGFVVPVTYPAIVGISNLLIHARVGLGWSPEARPVTQFAAEARAARGDLNVQGNA
ncbi:hypothetical protein R3P38DRAFT_3218909 [Favolaschia claudopus]|uniref:Uncharacterized protein n=1 Tax=Favolaschia claudopus TaxID=2862362 RepID=A0AAW0A3H1_9AGAR